MARFGPQRHGKEKFNGDEDSNCRNWVIHTILRPVIPVLQPPRAGVDIHYFTPAISQFNFSGSHGDTVQTVVPQALKPYRYVGLYTRRFEETCCHLQG